MQSLFRSILGASFDRLAPALKLHYDIAPGQTVWVQGCMDCWNRFEWARLFISFSPKNGRAVPVVVRNRTLPQDRGQNNQPCFEWQREFHYPSGPQLSYTLTQPDPCGSPACVLDMFNQPPTIGVTLKVEVSEDGRTLTQTAHGPQYAIFGSRRMALPGLFNIYTVAIERAMSDTRVQTEVVISHPMFGKLFGYSGALEVRRT